MNRCQKGKELILKRREVERKDEEETRESFMTWVICSIPFIRWVNEQIASGEDLVNIMLLVWVGQFKRIQNAWLNPMVSM